MQMQNTHLLLLGSNTEILSFLLPLILFAEKQEFQLNYTAHFAMVSSLVK